MAISRRRLQHYFRALGADSSEVDEDSVLPDAILSELIEDAASGMGIELSDKPEPSERTKRLARDFAAAVRRQLRAFGRNRVNARYFVRGEDADDLFLDFGPTSVLMTLRGDGEGIGDGRWDSHFVDGQAEAAIERLTKHLQSSLARWAAEDGSGLLPDAFRRDALALQLEDDEDDEQDDDDCDSCEHGEGDDDEQDDDDEEQDDDDALVDDLLSD
jgi:hypothetical protein